VSTVTEMPSRQYIARVRWVSMVKRLSGTARRARRGARQSASSAWSKSVADHERTAAALRAASTGTIGRHLVWTASLPLRNAGGQELTGACVGNGAPAVSRATIHGKASTSAWRQVRKL
jgi:hypothetical protein